MSKPSNTEKPQDLVKGSRKSTTPELTESDLGKVSGGSSFLKIDGIEGESQDDKHKDEIHIG
jgi:hypothetical protein